jgi:hypothetical protein
MIRGSLLSFARGLHPVELPTVGRVWLRVPTAGDLIDAEGKSLDWYLLRFCCNEDGSPLFREDEKDEALRVPAWVATKVVEEVGKLMQPPPYSSAPAADAAGSTAWQVSRGDGEADCHGALSLVAAG